MTQHQEPETPPENLGSRGLGFQSPLVEGSLLPSGSQHLQEAPTVQKCRTSGLLCPYVLLVSISPNSSCKVGFLTGGELPRHPTPNPLRESSVSRQVRVEVEQVLPGSLCGNPTCTALTCRPPSVPPVLLPGLQPPHSLGQPLLSSMSWLGYH